MAIAPDYAGGVQPAVGAGAEGARFQEKAAPAADLSPFFGAWRDVASVAAKELDAANDALFTDKDADLRRFLIRQKQDADSGFLNLHEANALKPDDNGASLPDRVLKDASDYRESIMDGWSAAQKAAFRAKTQDLLVSQYGAASEHLFRENEKYRISSSNARAAAATINGQINYSDPAAIEDMLAVGEQEARKQSDISGLSREDTEYAVRHMKGVMVSKAVGAAVDAAERDDQAIFTAKALIDRYGKFINPDDVIKLNSLVQKKFDSVEANQIGAEFFSKSVAQRQALFRVASSLFSAGSDGRIETNPAAMDLSDIHTFEQAHGVAQTFASAIVKQESGGLHFETDARGNKVVREGRNRSGAGTGAFGLMQITRGAYEYVAKNVYGRAPTEGGWQEVKNQPELNKQYGTDYFSLMLMQFKSVPMALAAYNAGPGRVSEAVKKYGSDWLAHMPEETRNYVPQVLDKLKAEQASNFVRQDGTKISALNSPQEFARQYYKQVPEAVIRESMRKQYPQLAASESKLAAAVAVVVKKQKDAVDALSTNQTNITARLLEKYGATGKVDQRLLSQLTLQGQSEVMRLVRDREAGSISGNISLLGAYLATHGTGIFTNKATNRPVSPDEAKVLISQLPPEWQKDALRTYAGLSAQLDDSQNRTDMNLAALQAGSVPAGYDTTTVSSTMQALKAIDPDTFDDENDPDKRAVAVAVNDALAEYTASGGALPKPGTNEFRDFVSRTILPRIEKKSFFSFLGFGPSNIRLIDYDPDSLPRSAPTSAGVLLDKMAMDYYVRRRRKNPGEELTSTERKEFFVRFFVMKNPGVRVLDYPMDSSTVEYINQKFSDDFRKRYGRSPGAAEMPDPLAVMREYIKLGAGGETVVRKKPADAPGGYISNGGISMGRYEQMEQFDNGLDVLVPPEYE